MVNAAEGQRALVVHINTERYDDTESYDEFIELAGAAQIKVVEAMNVRCRKPNSRFFIGSGKVAEIATLLQTQKVDVVLVNHSLSAIQERNLEKEFGCQVLDRPGLILAIFALRARSFEGKLQVELAQLRRLSTRLIRGWTHLERQKGGIGLRGPGETQLETDRRLIGHRIKTLKKRLQKVYRQRQGQRQSRHKSSLPSISLVGYTNAGKSTLFNGLTGANSIVMDQLFATLDPTIRRFYLQDDSHATLIDTVGFIKDLPHDLIAAFRSTLEETVEADLLLHVIDASDAERQNKIEQVLSVLDEIGAADVPLIEVYNKVDLLEQGHVHIDYWKSGKIRRIWVSAANKQGLDLVREAVFNHFNQKETTNSTTVGM